MPNILEIKNKYHLQIDSIDLDLLISHVIKKDRTFILSYPEHPLSNLQYKKLTTLINRRLKKEPLSYILGEKEFYGLNFKVNKHTLIPRPETELMVEMALEIIRTTEHANTKTTSANVIPGVSISERAKRFHRNTTIRDLQKENRSQISDFSTAHSSQEKSTFWDDTTVIDVGTGSGNIIISIANQLKITGYRLPVTNYFAVDISKEALKIAKQNAKLNKVDKNIKFLHGNLLNPFLKSKIINRKSSLLILANLPYLSKEIYNSCAPDVKKYEPKTALYSADFGLAHYAKLFSQIKKLQATNYEICPKAKLFGVTILIEISPEQKKLITPLVKKYFSRAKIEFKKDLAKKWRVAKIELPALSC